ncbi:hypothetical protein GQ457_09G006660 [Hibiscus cannabinus]
MGNLYRNASRLDTRIRYLTGTIGSLSLVRAIAGLCRRADRRNSIRPHLKADYLAKLADRSTSITTIYDSPPAEILILPDRDKFFDPATLDFTSFDFEVQIDEGIAMTLYFRSLTTEFL